MNISRRNLLTAAIGLAIAPLASKVGAFVPATGLMSLAEARAYGQPAFTTEIGTWQNIRFITTDGKPFKGFRAPKNTGSFMRYESLPRRS